MADAHKFSDRDKLVETFPNIALRTNLDTGAVKVYDEKADEYVAVEKGQYVVKIADRYEVHDKAPENAHKAETPKKASNKSEDTPKAVEGNQTVVPEELASDPGPESK